MNLLLLCGDKRQLIIKENLEKNGHTVKHVYFNDDTNIDFDVFDAIIFPLPTTRDGIFITNALSNDKIKISDIITRIKKQKIFCGNYSFENLSYFDYGKDESTAILNAIPTAEGAIAIAINNTPFTIWKSKCLVVGYGKIGKALSSKLFQLGANVTVSARRQTDLAFIESNGYTPILTSNIIETAQNYDIIFNTVDAQVITRDVLKKCRYDCLLIELASLPFGIDLKSAEELNRNVILAQGLPGKVAPTTSANILSDTIIKNLNFDTNAKW